MKKNRLFILLSIITILLIFAAAPTCNLCGTPIDIGETEVTTTQESDNEEQQTDQTSEEIQETTEENQNTEGLQGDNNPPKISVVEWADLGDINIVGINFNEMFVAPDPCSGIYDRGVPMSVTATDEDGDELTYSAYDSRGSSFDVTKIDNNNAEFYWLLPFETGPYTLIVEVSDNRSGADSFSIEMNFIPLPNSAPELGSINMENINTGETYPAVEDNNYAIDGGYKYSLEVEVWDQDCDTLSYAWTISDGSSSNHPTYVWVAPVPSENIILPPLTITVTVDDGRGGTSTKSGLVSFKQTINLS